VNPATVTRVTEPPDVTATRLAYDAVAVSYADALRDSLATMVWDRTMLAAFAELVTTGGGGPVGDLGCGPGRITGHLASLGLDAFGIDLSPAMVDVARRTHPGVRFDVGSMLGLDLPSASLGGILAYYSIIHLPLERRSELFTEFHRVLAPGGQLMLTFQVGDDRGHRSEAFGKSVSLDWYRLQPDEVAELLRGAGFEVWATVVRQPDATERVPQGCVLARKASVATATGA
jgi:SAM-dependent methyltransferase